MINRRRPVRCNAWLAITAMHPSGTLERCIWGLMRKVETFLGHLQYPSLQIIRMGERSMYDLMVIGLDDLSRVIRHDIEVLADRPAKHGCREQERYQRLALAAVKLHNRTGAQRQTQTSQDEHLRGVVDPARVDVLRVWPTAQVPPHVARLPVSHQIDQRCQK